MNILVTGGFGYAGARIAVELGARGHSVVLGTRQSVMRAAWLPQAQIARLAWSDPERLAASCRGVDAIVHAAGMNAKECEADPIEALEFNGVATARLVDAATRAGVKRFVYLSTAHVYSSSLDGVITEDSCVRNLHPYATSHLAGESAVMFAAAQGRLLGIVLRLSNAYGVPMHVDTNCWTLLVNDLCRQVVTRSRIRLSSTGVQLRDFIAMSDVSHAVAHLLDLDARYLSRTLFNLGGDSVCSVLHIAALVAERGQRMFGGEIPVDRDEVAAEPPSPLMYSSEAIKQTGFCLKGAMNDEIDATLRFCHDHFSSGAWL